MKKMKYILIIIAIISLLTGCGVTSKTVITKGQLYPKIYKKHPKSILVLPARNTTTSVDATNHFSYTITKPLAEKGYYVFPVHLVDSFLKSENLSSAEQIRQIPVKKLKEIFNADAILYVDINAWDTDYSVLSSSVDVGLSFSLVDATSGEEIWQNNAYAYSFSGTHGNGLAGLIVSAIAAAINSAVDYTKLAYIANSEGVKIMPSGPYHRDYKKDFNNTILFTNNTNLKDGRLYVNKYFIYGINMHFLTPTSKEVEDEDDFSNSLQINSNTTKLENLPLTALIRQDGYHGLSINNMNFFKHSGYGDYYLTQNINGKEYLRNRFFRYENNKPYLLANGKKVFVYVESDGKIPFSEESGKYYFNVDKVIELNETGV